MPDIVPTANLVVAESHAIAAFAEWLDTPEGRAASDVDVRLWLSDRGWPPKKFREWGERIAAQIALADPASANPQIIAARLNHRFERLAFKAEENNDLKHALAASEAQAKLNKVGGYAPQAQANIAIQVNASTAHLASDEDLARIASQAMPSPTGEAAPPPSAELDPLCQ